MKRRTMLIGGIGAFAATGIAWLNRNTITRAVLTSRTNEGVSLTSAADFNEPMCTVTPDQVEGPFFFAAPERRDIREDRSGVALALNLRVVSADGCTPVRGAAVEIWHCDAAGRYSGYPEDLARDLLGTLMLDGGPDEHVDQTNEKTFLRGRQVSDQQGFVAFKTIVPGWYEPRVPHVHVKVFVENKSYTTTQLYFEEALTQKIYAAHPDYVAYGASPYHVGNDLVLGTHPAADGLLLQPQESGEGLTANCRIAIG